MFTSAITVTENLDRRSIKLSTMIEQREEGAVHLTMTISHNDKGRYLISVWREIHARGFITVSIMEDSARREYTTVGARYSAKNLKAIAEEQQNAFAKDIEELTEWAKQIKSR